MIESNDISGEKMRMKETVEGEWPLAGRDAGPRGGQAGSAFEPVPLRLVGVPSCAWGGPATAPTTFLFVWL